MLRHVVGLTPGEIADLHGPQRELRPRAAPSRPPRAAGRAVQPGVGALDGAAQGRRMSATHSVPAAGELAVPFVRLDRDDPELLDELLAEVRRVAEASAFILGDHVEAFEHDFASYCEAEHAVGVGSGTDALAFALRAVGVGPDDEVIVPANTFIATAEAVSLAGARRCSSIPTRRRACSPPTWSRPRSPRRVRCILPVHLYGATVDMDPMLDLARAAGIPVVEDACQAHGARYKGRRVGSLGAAGCFSFYPAKNLGAWGDGGAVVHERRRRRRHRAAAALARRAPALPPPDRRHDKPARRPPGGGVAHQAARARPRQRRAPPGCRRAAPRTRWRAGGAAAAAGRTTAITSTTCS